MVQKGTGLYPLPINLEVRDFQMTLFNGTDLSKKFRNLVNRIPKYSIKKFIVP